MSGDSGFDPEKDRQSIKRYLGIVSTALYALVFLGEEIFLKTIGIDEGDIARLNFPVIALVITAIIGNVGLLLIYVRICFGYWARIQNILGKSPKEPGSTGAAQDVVYAPTGDADVDLGLQKLIDGDKGDFQNRLRINAVRARDIDVYVFWCVRFCFGAYALVAILASVSVLLATGMASPPAPEASN
ncbi:MAG: hypothetical protein RIM33_11525 [Alphaproteobacteria bacterium]